MIGLCWLEGVTREKVDVWSGYEDLVLVEVSYFGEHCVGGGRGYRDGRGYV